jgi:hypothetical protein
MDFPENITHRSEKYHVYGIFQLFPRNAPVIATHPRHCEPRSGAAIRKKTAPPRHCPAPPSLRCEAEAIQKNNIVIASREAIHTKKPEASHHAKPPDSRL